MKWKDHLLPFSYSLLCDRWAFDKVRTETSLSVSIQEIAALAFLVRYLIDTPLWSLPIQTWHWVLNHHNFRLVAVMLSIFWDFNPVTLFETVNLSFWGCCFVHEHHLQFETRQIVTVDNLSTDNKIFLEGVFLNKKVYKSDKMQTLIKKVYYNYVNK